MRAVGRLAPGVTLLLATLIAAPVAAGKAPRVPPLVSEHPHPSGAFTFRTPEGWSVGPSQANPNAFDASGAGVLVRFIYREGEVGYDSLHVDCMLERLAGAMDAEPRVKYEYDFLSGIVGEFRALDSAFVVKYDNPVQGAKEWRQRNLTLVGAGHSLCVIAYAPLPLWKKDASTRPLLDAVVASIAFKPRR